MELFKICVQSKQEAAFYFFVINQYCMHKMFYYKQVGDYVLVYSPLISIVDLMLCFRKCDQSKQEPAF